MDIRKQYITIHQIFLTLAMFVHGYASIVSNNSLEYDEELIKVHLKQVYTGAILAAQYTSAQIPKEKQDNDCCFIIIFCKRFEKKTSENNFFQKSDTKHTDYTADGTCKRIIDRNPIP